jgi:hypothetical protein
MATLKHTLMREDISTVNARQFSAERNDTTINMALDSIGTLYRTLLLTDEEDGVWQLDADVTIPANVVLHIPLGVTLVGPGDITILGGLEALRWPVHLGPGTIHWDDSTLGPTFALLRVGHGDFDTLNVSGAITGLGTLTLGEPRGEPAIPTVYQHSINMVDDATSEVGYRLGLWSTANVRLVSDSANFLIGMNVAVVIDPNNYHHTGGASALHANATISANGGTVDSLSGVVGVITHNGTAVLTQATCLHATTATVPTGTGPITNYYGVKVDDTARGTNAYAALLGFMAGTNRFNLYANGTAVNWMAGALTIGASASTGAFLLTVLGTAGKPGGSTWSDTCDRRLKANIVPVDDALALVTRFAPVTFDWTEPVHAAALPGRQFGFVADDMEGVLPQWVGESSDGYKTLDMVGMDALLVRAIQQLHDRVSVLEGDK